MPLIGEVRALTLSGVKITNPALFPDERGFFAEIIRRDWEKLVDEEVVQANLSFSYPGTVRAWHRHQRGQIDYFLVVQGSLKVCAYNDAPESPTIRNLVEVVLSSRNLQLLRIPGEYWHGFKVVGSEPATLVYFVNRLYDYENPDEERRPWDDPEIIPTSINGRKDDPRVGKPWNWLAPSHK